MKPISVKIEAFGPYTAEQTAEAFQKYCLYSGLVSAWGDKQLLSIKSFYSIIYNHESNHTVRFYTSDESRRQDKQCFTLPTQWNEFKAHLSEYISYHSKPVPKPGEYWITKKGKLVEIGEYFGSWKESQTSVKHLQVCHYDTFHHYPIAKLDRLATEEEIAEFLKPKPEVGQYWNVFIDYPGYYEDEGILKVVATDQDYKLPIDCLWTIDPNGNRNSYHAKWFKRPATPEEVEQCKKDELLSEAKRRYKGFCLENLITFTKRGSEINYCVGPIKDFHYLPSEDILYAYGAIIYHKGKWASIVEEKPSKEQHILQDMEENKKLRRRLIKKSERIKELEEGLRDSAKTIEFLIRKASNGIAVYSTSSEKRRIEAAVNKKAEELTELLNK
jgi:hypothetical protein